MEGEPAAGHARARVLSPLRKRLQPEFARPGSARSIRSIGSSAISPTRRAGRSRTGRPTGKRVLVVGAGPAGLSCAYQLRRLGHDVEIRDANPEPGGMMHYGIPAYRLPREGLGKRDRAHRSDGRDGSCATLA